MAMVVIHSDHLCVETRSDVKMEWEWRGLDGDDQVLKGLDLEQTMAISCRVGCSPWI